MRFEKKKIWHWDSIRYIFSNQVHSSLLLLVRSIESPNKEHGLERFIHDGKQERMVCVENLWFGLWNEAPVHHDDA